MSSFNGSSYKNTNERLLRGLSSLVTNNWDVKDDTDLKLFVPYKFHKYLVDVQGERDYEARIGEAMLNDPKLVEHAVRLYNANYEDSPIELSSVNPTLFKYRPLNSEGMTEEELNNETTNILQTIGLDDAESAYLNYYPSNERSYLSYISGYPYNKSNDYKNERLSKYLLVQPEDDFDTAEKKTDRMRSLGFVNPEAYDRYVREVLGRSNDMYEFDKHGVRNFLVDVAAPNVNKAHRLGHDASLSDIGADMVSGGVGLATGGFTKGMTPFVRAAVQGGVDGVVESVADKARAKDRIYSSGSDFIKEENPGDFVDTDILKASRYALSNAGLAALGYGGRKARIGEKLSKKLGNKVPDKTAEQIAEENKAAVTKHFTEDPIGKGKVTRAVNKELKNSTGSIGNARKAIDSAKSSIGEIDTKLAELNKQGENLAMERYRLLQTHRTPDNQRAIQGRINELSGKIKAIETEADKLRVTRAGHIKTVDTTELPSAPNADALREKVLKQKIDEGLKNPELLKKLIQVPEEKGKNYLDWLLMGLNSAKNSRVAPIIQSRFDPFKLYDELGK